MPFTHNIIEAMSCGCIPFLQKVYANMFRPPFIERKQVIAFENSGNLEYRLNYLFSMAEDEVQSMRNEVKIYYNNFLTPASVVKTIEETQFQKFIYRQNTIAWIFLKVNGISKNLLILSFGEELKLRFKKDIGF